MEAKAAVTITPLDEGRSKMLIEGYPQEWVVPGVVLEHYVKLENGRYLVFTTDNCPYEEALHLLLISAERQEYEQVNIGQINTPGIFKDPVRSSQDCIEFTFIGDTRFRASVTHAPKVRLATFLSPSFIQYVAPFSKKCLHIKPL